MSSKVDTNKFIPRFVSHHFSNADQEFESCKLGMWLFLLTEFMLFGGIFVAYVVFRTWYPETFESGAEKLDWKMGAVNTVILITSSVTMAVAIREVQLNRKGRALALLLFTVLCGMGFLVVKYFEYNHKFELGIFPGDFFSFMGDHMSNEHLYFSIYFMATATHVLHVILGLLAILWVSWRTAKGEFYEAYYTPVEMVGLYWHLVDLIWIFLFPLLYLTK
ncbi:cytochrome c oxidase subunit 3 family protein [Lentisphaera marina]|uniref:cytochrome c oxidase subunit 3 family protein n=1 Tax=Lentisphaera marina TaxID=1111041 RepID=UPI00236503C1|nr:cytochrome c oxidase subunit 3 family protein [Lentisphaera marina]MDD7985678.1 cytochrome c oxidase subunit 3 family protein [Lentisphaera marina]